MALKEYKTTGPTGMEITVQLSDDDAERWGLSASDVVKRPKKAAAAKQAAPEDKQAQPSDKRAEVVSKSFGGSQG
jgi:hypothetical protein